MDIFDNEENFEGYTINYEKIVSDTNRLSVTRLLASTLTNNPYLQVSQFFKNINDTDLQLLMDVADGEEENDMFGDLILIAEMLACAEGLPGSEDIDDYQMRVKQLIAMLALESLYRNDLIELFRENMSFGEELSDKMIARKKPGVTGFEG